MPELPDYGDILAFLSQNPPELDTERDLHASLLELLAHCLRSGQSPAEIEPTRESFADHGQLWLHFN